MSMLGITREANESYRDEPTDGRFGAFGVARKQEAAPSLWEADLGRFVQKAAIRHGLEKRGESDDIAYYGNYQTGERLFVVKASGLFMYDHPAAGMPRQGHVEDLDDSLPGPLVSKGEQIDQIKPKAGKTPVGGKSTDAASDENSFAAAHRKSPKG